MLHIYKASAGSGKTFALTLEYFRLVFENPREYRNILAVTFTNKATEEMKSRIINELHRLAEGEGSSYGEILKRDLGLDDQCLKNKAALLRTLLLHDYGNLSVTTIDRFFQRIMKAFTRELGIFPGYNVELDSEFVLQKAVDKVLQKMKGQSELKSWIGELMDRNVEEGKSWSVKSKIADLGRELFRENYMLLDRHIQEKFRDRQFLKGYRDALFALIGDYEREQTAPAREAVGRIEEKGLCLADFKGGKAGCASFFYKVLAGKYEAPTVTVRKGAEQEEAWLGKMSPVKEKIEELRPVLMRSLQEMLEKADDGYVRYLSARQMAGNLYQLGILNDLYREIRAYCDERGVMLLSDTTRMLNLLIAGNDTSFLFEKYGNYYRHLMIDEFQDTSSMQWKNFCPLVVNSLGEGGKAMIVGDVKQSIYRWRNGEWELLAGGVEKQFGNFGFEKISLDDNWRSAREIVEFNNSFFKAAAETLAGRYVRDSGAEDRRAQMIREAYRDAEQTPRRERHGYVDIAFGPEEGEETAGREIMQEVVAAIGDIVRRGGRKQDIVILVRSGKEGAFAADYLMEYNKTAEVPVQFVSNDSLFVRSSPYVQLIIAVLRYLTEPHDRINRATVLWFYHTFVSGEENIAFSELLEGMERQDLFAVLGVRLEPEGETLLSYSLYETVEMIIDGLSLKAKEQEVPYLIAFQDIVYEYETVSSNDISLFLEWWEKEKGKRVLSTSEEVDAVRILTIHKSKGLEFDYVILPFCNWELDGVHPVRRIWCRNREPELDALEYVPLDYSSKLADTVYREDYLDEHAKAYIDNLNLLYVAFTRAKTELYVRAYAPKRNKDGSISGGNIAAFLFQVLSAMGQGFREDAGFKTGMKQERDGGKAAVEQTFSLKAYPLWRPGERISVKYRFRDYTETEHAALSAIDEGKLLHGIFKSIRYASDVEQAVCQACREGLIRRSGIGKYRKEISDYLATPQAAEWFLPGCEVIAEKDILFPSGKKARPDRVVLSGGTVYVIDYKFGQREENAYLRQVRFYCDTLVKMGYGQVRGYVWYVKAGKIVPVR